MRPNTNFPVKQREIIKVALDLFLEKGYENTKIADIMKAAQLSKGGMYHYFASKEEILDAAIRYVLEEERPVFEKKLRAASTVGEKMGLIISSEILAPSELRSQVVALHRKNLDGTVHFRIQKLNREFATPYLEEVIRFGIDEGLFSTGYPREIAECLYLAGERTILGMEAAATPEEGRAMAHRRAAAFGELVSRALAFDPVHFGGFVAALEEELLQQAQRFLAYRRDGEAAK